MPRPLLALAALTLLLRAAPARADVPSGCATKDVTAAFGDFLRTGKMPPDTGRWLYDKKAQYIAPWKAFDNVHFVGICWVSAWLITSPKGHILIDTLYDPFVDTLLDNIRKVGADPRDIKVVLITHGHFDHAAGAAKLKPLLPRARFVMTETGWREGAESAAASQTTPRPWTMLAKDVVAKEGDTFTAGGVTVRVFETPGHTFGTASYAYDVMDGKTVEHAVTVGGLGLNAIKDASQVEAYLASVKKLRALITSADHPVRVHLTTHPFSNGMFEAAAGLKTRKPGEPHPLVNQPGILKQLDGLEASAKDRLEIERAKK
ncbi:MAG: MBL fold metallo-hydrolase [Deltaproteobacteria bacterium]|nr:MAG: MBL fold metallo-hydrolase [Deltaproteobacteria bacterium]TMQ17575.1 MAG: MBL fold metallo-hydrolase [Deltaproteobacteria bacterium]